MDAKRARLGAELPFDAKRRQVFVVGNEAGDADSLVSAYAMAARLDGPEVQAVALAQMPREEFRLRGDALALFRRAGSELMADGSPARMRFWDEVDWDAVRQLESRAVVLTDHNKMTPQVAAVFEGRVQLILDHHADSKAHPEARVVLDEGLGSACTLVAEQFSSSSQAASPEIGALLAGVIVLDTRNFDLKEKKGTPRDRAAFDGLASHAPPEGTDAWFRDLMRARYDVSHLSVRELLLLDMKAAAVEGFAGQVAFCAMMGTLDGVVAKAGGDPAAFVEVLQAFAKARGFAAVVCNFAADEHKLKGVAFVPATGAEQPLCDHVERRLAEAPGNLPPALRDNPLYATQGIVEHGFGLRPRPDLAPLRAFGMRAEITRKTLLPRVVTAADSVAS